MYAFKFMLHNGPCTFIGAGIGTFAPETPQMIVHRAGHQSQPIAGSLQTARDHAYAFQCLVEAMDGEMENKTPSEGRRGMETFREHNQDRGKTTDYKLCVRACHHRGGRYMNGGAPSLLPTAGPKVAAGGGFRKFAFAFVWVVVDFRSTCWMMGKLFEAREMIPSEDGRNTVLC
ncbi:long tail fiber proximal subunit [Anopheles sinensis]|uniref:Long tail fiber proximal subunit n=1 Tax=Anopheles sinensis TaxID=74873 RepID=A0A084WK48_ANOSI|nr:long tail fiber proximal subunit [Anopheles sinensis]